VSEQTYQENVASVTRGPGSNRGKSNEPTADLGVIRVLGTADDLCHYGSHWFLCLPPRIRDLGKITLVRGDSPAATNALYPHAGPLLADRWKEDLVAECYPDLLRMGGSLTGPHGPLLTTSPSGPDPSAKRNAPQLSWKHVESQSSCQ
jgi:hypothetical protein